MEYRAADEQYFKVQCLRSSLLSTGKKKRKEKKRTAMARVLVGREDDKLPKNEQTLRLL
jgi:hypothetical protein